MTDEPVFGMWVRPGHGKPGELFSRPVAYGITFGRWDDPDQFQIEGFASLTECWEFLVANGLYPDCRPPRERKQ